MCVGRCCVQSTSTGCVPRRFIPKFYGSGELVSGAGKGGVNGGDSSGDRVTAQCEARVESSTVAAPVDVFADGRSQGKAAARQHVLLEDLTGSMQAPCVADIKVGTKTWRRGSLATKVSRILYKYVTRVSLADTAH